MNKKLCKITKFSEKDFNYSPNFFECGKLKGSKILKMTKNFKSYELLSF